MARFYHVPVGLKREQVRCNGLLGGRLVRLTELVDLKGKAAVVSDR
jgi:hypothetical protein